MKTRIHIFVVIVLSLAAIVAGLNIAPVAADSCTAQLTNPVMPTVYYGSSVPIVVPMSVTCNIYYGASLYATANVYDTTSGTSLGSVSVSLNSVNSGNVFNGQIGFNLPASTQGHWVQISTSVYSSQYGSLLTTTSISFLVSNTPQQITTTTVTQATYPYPYPYQNSNPYAYPSPPFQNSQQHHNFYQQQNQTQGTNNMLVYVAIIAILAAVVIATTGLVIFSQRRPQPQPYWIPGPPPPGR
ncbi:MAG TPA: hypothetical protein VLV18_05265 [Terriglobales bacterium]|nr:hypothetical protein [Terriglobales bacterium]